MESKNPNPEPKGASARSGLVAGALVLTLGGLALGVILFLFELLLDLAEKALSYVFHLAPSNVQYAGHVLSEAVAAALLIFVAAILIWATYTSIFKTESRRRKKAAQYVLDAVAGQAIAFHLISSEDGELMNIVLEMAKDSWNNSAPFYDSRIVGLSHWNTEKSDKYLYPLFLEWDGRDAKTASDLPLEADKTCAVTMKLEFSKGVISWPGILALIHKTFSEGKIAILTPAVTAICVYLLSYHRLEFEQKTKNYFDEVFWPAVSTAEANFSDPPKGLAFSHIEVDISSKGHSRPKFVQKLKDMGIRPERRTAETWLRLHGLIA